MNTITPVYVCMCACMYVCMNAYMYYVYVCLSSIDYGSHHGSVL